MVAVVLMASGVALWAGLYGAPAWFRHTPSPPAYPALTVANAVVNGTFGWTINYSGSPKLGALSANTSFVEDVSRNGSTLRMYVGVWPDAHGADYLLDQHVLVTGNLSPSVAPPSITVSDQDLNGSLSTCGSSALWGNPGLGPPPVNITGYPAGTVGQVRYGMSITYGLANLTSSHTGRYSFLLPLDPEQFCFDPANGTSAWNTFQIRASLTGLGQPVFCEATMEIQAAMPAAGLGPYS